jgi:hypothetical protein
MQGVALIARQAAAVVGPYKQHSPAMPGLSRQADEGNRTPNLLITNQLLYQLSYVSGIGEKRRTGYQESS